MARVLVVSLLLFVMAAVAGSAQADLKGLRSRLETRFEMLPIADGVVLTPRFKTSVRSVELSESMIAIDGTPVTGPELRQRLGNDADLVIQLSYLDSTTRRMLARGEDVPQMAPRLDQAAPVPDADSMQEKSPGRARRREDIVRIGGSVSVASDETVRGDVVVVGGNATVDGEVDGEVVVIAGSANFGPQAVVRGDVTIVGGRLAQDPAAVLRGEVHEIGFGDVPWRGDWMRGNGRNWTDGIYPVARLTGTLVRIALLVLLTAMVLFVARAPVERIADRVAADPVKSWFVGFLAEMLALPVLIMTIVVLAISIIGIPLLVLVPVAIVAGLVVLLVGFTAVAYQLGRLLQDKVQALRDRPFAATFAGIVIIVSPALLARLLGLTGELGLVVWPIAAVGFLLEYIAWTAGLGAAALARFSPTSAPQPVSQPPMIGS